MQAQTKHSQETLIYTIACLIERAAFYSTRGVLLFYLLELLDNGNNAKAFDVFSYFVIAATIGKIIGGLAGDLIKRRKLVILAGGVIQAAGCLLIYSGSFENAELGMYVLALGIGLFKVNLEASLGRSYLTRPKSLDSGLMIYYLGANVGGFIGSGFIVNYGLENNLQMSFLISAFLALLASALPLILLKKTVEVENTYKFEKISAIRILVIVLFTLCFSFLMTTGTITFGSLKLDAGSAFDSEMDASWWELLGGGITMLIMGLLALLWTFRYTNQLFKLLVSFILMGLGFGLCFIVSEPYSGSTLFFIMMTLFLFTIADTYIAPVLASITLQNVNPKFYGIALSLLYLPAMLSTFILLPIRSYLHSIEEGNFYLVLSFASLLLGTIVYLIYSTDALKLNDLKESSQVKETAIENDEILD
ncbi:MAG: hypothetical protein MK105_17915 [Crocinitomicaceae bacterium]|nr:hypothetical protein [Crocinitomicaceae bacterium]